LMPYSGAGAKPRADKSQSMPNNESLLAMHSLRP
jgi:hypothetical protein